MLRTFRPISLVMTLTLFANPASTFERNKSSLVPFPQQRLFEPRTADPREVQLAVRLRLAQREFAGNIGYSVGLLQVRAKQIPWQLRIEGNTFLVSKVQSPDFPVQSTDYTLSIPIDFRVSAFSGRVAWSHISSHLGDDFNRIDDVENSILFYGDGTSYFSKPKKFSREFIKLFGSFDFTTSRAYTGIIWAYHIATSKLEQSLPRAWILQVGYEWEAEVKRHKIIYPFLALDLKARQELRWIPEVNLQTGFVIGQKHARRMRVGLELFQGNSNQGQFLSRKEKDLSLIIAFDF